VAREKGQTNAKLFFAGTTRSRIDLSRFEPHND
jgi:hypothetical protein